MMKSFIKKKEPIANLELVSFEQTSSGHKLTRFVEFFFAKNLHISSIVWWQNFFGWSLFGLLTDRLELRS
ncbi:hypothetical protein P8452_56796 [Trifolium repens]|nr:hypothetical protein P8452_56796 [Trifolium repens]